MNYVHESFRAIEQVLYCYAPPKIRMKFREIELEFFRQAQLLMKLEGLARQSSAATPDVSPDYSED